MHQSTQFEQGHQMPHHSMPTFDEAVLKHTGAKYFTKLDACHGYWSLELNNESSKLTPFNTPHNQYKVKWGPFGLISMQDKFQHCMGEAFEGFSVIVDDIIISGQTEEKHAANVHSALIRANQKQVKFNLQKCVFKLIGQHTLLWTNNIQKQHQSRSTKGLNTKINADPKCLIKTNYEPFWE